MARETRRLPSQFLRCRPDIDAHHIRALHGDDGVPAFRLATTPGLICGFDADRLAQGAPVVTGAALVLLASHDWLGRLYGQHGPWWSTLIQVLAISLPLRFAANVMRAILQSQGAFAAVATVDSAAFWLLAISLVAVGLYADSPIVAYLSLILPEAACAAWLWRRFQLSRHANSASARAWPLRLRLHHGTIRGLAHRKFEGEIRSERRVISSFRRSSNIGSFRAFCVLVSDRDVDFYRRQTD